MADGVSGFSMQAIEEVLHLLDRRQAELSWIRLVNSPMSVGYCVQAPLNGGMVMDAGLGAAGMLIVVFAHWFGALDAR